MPDSPDGPRREPDTEFEWSVGRIVQSLGFDVHFQVGTMGFSIDLAIPDPASSARYLCGIECDGAPYHSHPTARDRDRLREEILRARGWDIYRIWSTDWYRNRKTEVERLRSYLQQKAGIQATAAPERDKKDGQQNSSAQDVAPLATESYSSVFSTSPLT